MKILNLLYVFIVILFLSACGNYNVKIGQYMPIPEVVDKDCLTRIKYEDTRIVRLDYPKLVNIDVDEVPGKVIAYKLCSYKNFVKQSKEKDITVEIKKVSALHSQSRTYSGNVFFDIFVDLMRNDSFYVCIVGNVSVDGKQKEISLDVKRYEKAGVPARETISLALERGILDFVAAVNGYLGLQLY